MVLPGIERARSHEQLSVGRTALLPSIPALLVAAHDDDLTYSKFRRSPRQPQQTNARLVRSRPLFWCGRCTAWVASTSFQTVQERRLPRAICLRRQRSGVVGFMVVGSQAVEAPLRQTPLTIPFVCGAGILVSDFSLLCAVVNCADAIRFQTHDLCLRRCIH